MRIWLVATLIVLRTVGTSAAQTQPLLQLQGQAYFGGGMTLHLSASSSVGQPALVGYGLNPLTTPVPTGKGPWYVGGLVNLVAIGSIPAGGRIDLSFTMPPLMPALAGTPIILQGYVPFQLSNPATLVLDMPYFLPSNATVIPNPNPSPGANFGDRLATGDLNADGSVDLVVGAWFEDYLGIDKAGRVYVLWGPGWSTYTTLQPSVPRVFGTFGASVTVADLDQDGTDDLVIAETPSDPPPPNEFGYLRIFLGSPSFSSSAAISIPSAGTGVAYAVFGRVLVVGDFNDDVAPDIAVGILGATVNGQSNAGRIDLYWGPDYSVRTEIPNPTPLSNDFFGTALRAVDLNGDSIDDLVEGSGRADLPGAENGGKVHVFIGPSLGLLAMIPNPLGLQNARFGEGLHVDDVDGDGQAEIIAADVKNRLFIFSGPAYSSYTLQLRPPTAFQNPFGETVFGEYLASTDANGDEIPDLVVADYFSGALSGCSPAAEGTVYVSLGPYFATYRVLFEPQPACGDGFSWGLITDDLDADRSDEILAGSPTAEVGLVFNAGACSILRP